MIEKKNSRISITRYHYDLIHPNVTRPKQDIIIEAGKFE